MKKYFILAILCLGVSGCVGGIATVTKSFKVVADPADSVIRVVSGEEAKEEKFSSPASINVDVPQDATFSHKNILEVSRDKYKPVTIALRQINDGDTLKIKLEKIVYYQMKYRLIRPIQSDELKFQDGSISISLTIGEQSFKIDLKNIGTDPLKILWEQAEYTDVYRKLHRIMPSTVRYENRNNALPSQVLQIRNSIQETMTPIDNVYVSPQTKGYEIKPLFVREGDRAAGLKGQMINLFIPIEINRAIIPYNFKIEIADIVKEADKK
jgi:hypothetical protein